MLWTVPGVMHSVAEGANANPQANARRSKFLYSSSTLVPERIGEKKRGVRDGRTGLQTIWWTPLIAQTAEISVDSVQECNLQVSRQWFLIWGVTISNLS